MPDAIQCALSALWRFFLLMLGIFGVAYIVWNAQVDPVPAFLVPSSWFLFCYMLLFPTSQPAAGLVYCFDQLDDSDTKAVILVFAAILSFHSLYQRSPAAMIYIVAFGIIDFGITQRDVYRAAMDSATGPLGDAPQPDTAAAAEAEDFSDNNTATEHEASLASEPEQPAEQEPLDNAEPSSGPLVLIAVTDGASVVKPKSWARNAMNIIWSFLWFVLKLGAAAAVIHTLLTVLLKSWALTPEPVDIAPLFEAEVAVQANKTQLPIPVPMAEFIPTGTFGSPCQAAPTPIPVAKSIVTVTSTPMPTPMPAPTPSAVPEPVQEPEPVAVPDEAFELLSRMFDLPVPDPKPLLMWYFDLPPSSQYAVIVASLLVLWCLSKPLFILAPHLIILAIDYFAAAAMLPLLFRYGFDPKQSIAITWAADCALTASIWYVAYRLRNLEALCRNDATNLDDIKSQFEVDASGIADLRIQCEDNASGLSDLRSQVRDNDAGLTGLGIRFEEFVAQSKLGWADTVVKPIAAIKKMLHIIVFCVGSIGNRVDAIAKTVRHHATEIYALGKEVSTKADLDQTIRILEQLSGKIAGLETSKADAGILRAAQEDLESLRSLVESLQSEKANAADLKRVREELEKLRDCVNDLQNTKADATAVANITDKVKGLATDLTEIREAQDKLNTDVGTLKRDRDVARKDIESLNKTSTQHVYSISKLEESAKISKDALNGHKGQVGNEKKAADEKMSKLEKENAHLRQDVSNLQGAVEGLQQTMEAMEAKEAQHEHRLNQVRDEVTSDTDQKVNQLRSDTDSQHHQVVQAHRELEGSVTTRFDKSAQDVKELRQKARSEINDLGERIRVRFNEVNAAIWDRFSEITKNINNADGGTPGVLQRVEALESRAGGSIAELQVDDYIRGKVEQFVGDFLREHLRAQVYRETGKYLFSKEGQDKIFAILKERQACEDNNLPGDPPGVVPGGRASSPGIGPSDSGATPDNTIGDDGPLGDPPGVISGGQAALPGDMSSDDNTTPTIPEESIFPDDVDDHHGSRGVPLGEPPGACLRGRAKSLGGSTSAGPSCDGGAGPRPSGEDDDGTLQPKRRERSKSCGPGILPDEQLRGPANPEQPGGYEEMDEEETDEEEMDDDNDDDAHDGGDDDESDDDDPPGPPPGSGGSNGHNGTDGKDDDDQDGDNGGAPRPFTGHGITRGAAGLANSSYASDPTSGTGNFRSQSPAAGAAGHTNDTRQKPKKAKAFEDATPSQQNRRRKQWHKILDKKAEGKQARKEEELARQEAQALNPPEAVNPPEVAQKQPRNRSNRKRGRHGKGNQQGGQQGGQQVNR
ncbi:hypothetical protein FJTKL_13470 [Diaporthe vaccinii]|uniref:Uncharacterized protein n=1 Tax=Diaporthe vaccinii TaxID=105482 RepID=A0ABR4EAI3_9PEZI